MENLITGIKKLFKFRQEIKSNSCEGDEVENVILSSMLYLARNTENNGRFVYRNSTNPERRYSEKYYSSLRHAGTLYSMYQCEKYLGNMALAQKRRLASEYFIKNYVKRIDDDKYGVVSKPFEEAPVLLSTSGGTGLGLIALSNLLPEKQVRLSQLRKMGNFLIYMQSEDGDFTSCYEFGKKQKSDLHYARYYPGEACLGLLYLYEQDIDIKWLEAAKRGIVRFSILGLEQSFDKFKFDHWGLLAINKLFELDKITSTLTKTERNLLIEYSEKNVKRAIDSQILDCQNEDTYGAYNFSQSLCGNATVLEGLSAAYEIIPGAVLKQRILNSIEKGMLYLSKYQVKTGKHEGGIPKSCRWNFVDTVDKDKEIRIDYVQHTLSAFILCKLLLK